MKIASLEEAETWLQGRPEYYDVISIGREVSRRSLCRRQIVLDFDDLCTLPDPGDRPDDRAPQEKHITLALSFARKSDDERLLLHCRAGLSRSPAIAWCILLDRLKRPELATSALFKLRPRAIPNAILVYGGLKLLTGSDQEFRAVREQMRTRSRHPHKILFL